MGEEAGYRDDASSKNTFLYLRLEMTTKYIICFRASGRLSRLKQGLAPTAVEGALDKLPDSGFDLASTIQVRFKSC